MRRRASASPRAPPAAGRPRRSPTARARRLPQRRARPCGAASSGYFCAGSAAASSSAGASSATAASSVASAAGVSSSALLRGLVVLRGLVGLLGGGAPRRPPPLDRDELLVDRLLRARDLLGLRGRRFLGGLRGLRSGSGPQLADARLLADLLAQVVELRAVDVADRGDLDLLDLRRVHRERPLDADAERLLAHGERLARARALALDTMPSKTCTRRRWPSITWKCTRTVSPALKRGQVLAQLALLDALDDRAHGKRPSRAAERASAERMPGSRQRHGDESVRRPVGREDLADHVLARHGAPLPGVARLRAVVAHHEVLALRTWYVRGGRVSRRRVRDVRLVELAAVDVDVGQAALRAELDPLARETDDPLDERAAGAAALARRGRRLEDDDVAPLRILEVVDEPVREHAVREARLAAARRAARSGASAPSTTTGSGTG